MYAYKTKSTKGSWSVEDMIMSAICLKSIRNWEWLSVKQSGGSTCPGQPLQRHLETGDPVPRLGFFKPAFTLIRNTNNTYTADGPHILWSYSGGTEGVGIRVR